MKLDNNPPIKYFLIPKIAKIKRDTGAESWNSNPGKIEGIFIIANKLNIAAMQLICVISFDDNLSTPNFSNRLFVWVLPLKT